MTSTVKNQLKILCAAALITSTGSVFANKNIQWNELSASYENYDNGRYSRTGISFSGAKLLDNNVFIQGRYSILSGEEVFSTSVIDQDLDWLTVGLGYKGQVAKNTDLFGTLSYERLNFEESGENFGIDKNTNKGYSLELGVRSLVTTRLELSGSIRRFDLETTHDTGFNLGARYAITEPFWIGVTFFSLDDTDRLNISAIWHY